MGSQKIVFPRMLSFVLIFLSILLFIPNITMFRIIQIGNFQESLAILFFPFVYSIAGSITEVYGKENAIYLLVLCYAVSLFFSLVLMMSCYLPYPADFPKKYVYDLIFSKGPYVILIGIFSVSLSIVVNVRLMSKLKVKMRNRHFIIRSIVSSSIGEIIITGIAYPLLFLSLNRTVLLLMLNAYLFKVVYSIFGAFPAKLLVFLMRKIDGIDKDDFSKEFQKNITIGFNQKNLCETF